MTDHRGSVPVRSPTVEVAERNSACTLVANPARMTIPTLRAMAAVPGSTACSPTPTRTAGAASAAEPTRSRPAYKSPPPKKTVPKSFGRGDRPGAAKSDHHRYAPVAIRQGARQRLIQVLGRTPKRRR